MVKIWKNVRHGISIWFEASSLGMVLLICYVPSLAWITLVNIQQISDCIQRWRQVVSLLLYANNITLNTSLMTQLYSAPPCLSTLTSPWPTLGIYTTSLASQSLAPLRACSNHNNGMPWSYSNMLAPILQMTPPILEPTKCKSLTDTYSTTHLPCLGLYDRICFLFMYDPRETHLMLVKHILHYVKGRSPMVFALVPNLY